MPMARSPTAFGEDSYDQTGRDEFPTTQGLRRGRSRLRKAYVAAGSAACSTL